MTGSGTTRDVIQGLNRFLPRPIEYWGGDLRHGFDLVTTNLPGLFDLVWVHAESFHSRVRDELPNTEVFEGAREAKALDAAWKQEYNHQRPRSPLGYVPPAMFAGVEIPEAIFRRRCSSMRCGHRQRGDCIGRPRPRYHHPTLIAPGTENGGTSGATGYASGFRRGTTEVSR